MGAGGVRSDRATGSHADCGGGEGWLLPEGWAARHDSMTSWAVAAPARPAGPSGPRLAGAGEMCKCAQGLGKGLRLARVIKLKLMLELGLGFSGDIQQEILWLTTMHSLLFKKYCYQR